MAKINNIETYPIKETISSNDYLLGSDSEDNGKTVNIKISTIVEQQTTVDDDNKFIPINYGKVIGNGITTPDVASAINAIITPITITFDKIPVFTGLVYNGERTYYVVYTANNKGKGSYGSGGSITVANSDLIFVSSTLVYSQDFIDYDPNSNVKILGEIGATPLVDFINNSVSPTVIDAGENQYFSYTVSAVDYISGFSGAAGIYGLGQSQMVANELFLVYDQTVKVTPTKLSDLTDDSDFIKSTDPLDADTLEGQAGAYYLAYGNLTGVPATFAPSAHTHVVANITDFPTLISTFTNDSGYITSADGGNAATVGGFAEAALLKSNEADTKTLGNLSFNTDIFTSFGTISKFTFGHSSTEGNILKLTDDDFKIKDGVNIRITFGRTTGSISTLGNITGGAIIKSGGDGTNILLDDGSTAPKNGIAYTVAGLPSTPTQGQREFVTDATVTTFASVVAGGGANVVPVFYNGTDWIIG